MSKSSVRRVRSRRPSLESLESRALLSTVHLLVNTLDDDPTGPVAGQTTLRDIITAADALSAGDKAVIKFAVDGTIALTAPLPDLTGNIAIKGPGAANLTIERPSDLPYFAIFNISSEPSDGTGDKISDLTIKGGAFSGIQIQGELIVVTMKNVDFIDNTALSAGGAIDNFGNLTVKNCVFSDNYAFEGGAICNQRGGVLKLYESTFTGNAAYPAGPGLPGVGTDILNWGTATIGKKIIKDLGDGIYNTGTINSRPPNGMMFCPGRFCWPIPRTNSA